MSDDLTPLFENSAVPAPRPDLADRIATAAMAQAPMDAANDRNPWLWKAAAGIAATLVAGFFVLNSQPEEAELWATEAELAGHGDLYAWVYAEEAETGS